MRVESNSDGTQTWVYLLCEGKIFIPYDSPLVKKVAMVITPSLSDDLRQVISKSAPLFEGIDQVDATVIRSIFPSSISHIALSIVAWPMILITFFFSSSGFFWCSSRLAPTSSPMALDLGYRVIGLTGGKLR